jgi:hypothetical protein
VAYFLLLEWLSPAPTALASSRRRGPEKPFNYSNYVKERDIVRIHLIPIWLASFCTLPGSSVAQTGNFSVKPSQNVYRLPFANGTRVKVFDDFITHRPPGRNDLFAVDGHDTVTKKARLKVGDWVKAGQYLGDEGAVGCAMLQHVHFEVAIPNPEEPLDSGGFLTDNENGKRERNPRFCDVPGGFAVKGAAYRSRPC